jgi:hypothetical protein
MAVGHYRDVLYSPSCNRSHFFGNLDPEDAAAHVSKPLRVIFVKLFQQ